jgi:hypothetical protein
MGTSTMARFIAVRLGRQIIALGGLLRIVGLDLMILILELGLQLSPVPWLSWWHVRRRETYSTLMTRPLTYT